MLPAALAPERVPEPVRDVLRTLARAGHRSWLVGGAVRDLLLGRHRETPDFDVATPATPDQVTALFPRVIPTGIEHGTVTVLAPRGAKVEVTTFRGEGEYRDGRRPSSVTFLRDLEGDLSRRDFTVNAMAWDPLAGELRDPYAGQADLARGLVRAVGEAAARFAEDGLRPLRAVRFAAQLGYEVEASTLRAIPGALEVVRRVSAERVGEELSKLLVAPRADRGLALMDESGLLEVVLPELAALAPAARRHAIAAAAAANRELVVRLAGLGHALALDEPRDGAAQRLRAALSRLRFPGRTGEEAAALVAAHGCVLEPARPEPDLSPVALRRWMSRVGPARVEPLLALWAADAAAVDDADRHEEELARFRRLRTRAGEVLQHRPPLATGDLAIDGRAVMEALALPPGREVGEALRWLLEHVLQDPALNTREKLLEALRSWWTARPARPG